MSSSARSRTISERRSPRLLTRIHAHLPVRLAPRAPKELQAMTREIGMAFPVRSAGLAARVGVLRGAGLRPVQPAQPCPNMGQDLTPLGTLVTLNPGLSDDPNWTATHAVTTRCEPAGGHMLVLTSGFNRVYNNPLTDTAAARGVDCRGFAGARVRLRHYVVHAASETSAAGHESRLQRDCLRSDRVWLFTWPAAPSDNFHIFTLIASTGLWAEATDSPISLAMALSGVWV